MASIILRLGCKIRPRDGFCEAVTTLVEIAFEGVECILCLE